MKGLEYPPGNRGKRQHVCGDVSTYMRRLLGIYTDRNFFHASDKQVFSVQQLHISFVFIISVEFSIPKEIFGFKYQQKQILFRHTDQ